ncbi:MAG: ABC transporter substrate-binding protein [Solirubrobacterales bacterium]
MTPTEMPQDQSSRRNIAVSTVALLLAFLVCLAVIPGASSLGKVPDRVVALTPFAANTMANLGTRPIAVGQTLGGDRRLASVLITTPRLKLIHPVGPSLEQLVQQKPDLVLTSSQWAKGTEAMRNLGMDVRYAEPTTIGGVYAQTRQIAKVMNREARGSRLIRQIRRQINRSTGNYKSRPKVMLILGVGRSPFTFLPNSWGGQLMKLAGAQLVTGGATGKGGFERISDEVVVAENPDVIIAVPHAETEDIPSMVDYIKTNPAWELTDAAQENRVYVSTDNRLLQAGTDIGQTIGLIRRQYLRN